jgi:MFS family permease
VIRDRRILYAAAFLRALAVGMVAPLLGVHLSRLGMEPRAIGVIVALGLAGSATGMLGASLWGDRGRRATLRVLAALGLCGGLGAALGSEPVLLGALAFLGMVNGMGRDRGGPLVLELAILPGTVSEAERTRTLAWYNVLQDAGHAAGSLLVALPRALRALGLGEMASSRGALLVYTGLIGVTLLLYLLLSPRIEIGASTARVPISQESRRLLFRISALFAFDSLAGGFLTGTLLTVFFQRRFGAGEAAVGALFFGARVLNALSHLGAAWLAKRIGLVNTMVFTHIPSSLLLCTVPFAPSFAVAAMLFLIREGLVEMDVPTRQSYVMAVVRPEERTFASGVTNLVRTASWAVMPSLAGVFMQSLALATPLFFGAGMKIAYDFALWFSFRRIHPPEERR